MTSELDQYRVSKKNVSNELEQFRVNKPKPVKTPYDVPEYTPEQLKGMTLEQRRQYVEDLKTEREYRQSAGFTKGALSGATLGASENIDLLKPQEGEYLSTTGNITGSLLPFSGLLKAGQIAVKPLVNFAAKSPVAAKQLQSLANLTGVAAAGFTEQGLHDAFQGKIPSLEEMTANGALWASLEIALNAAGKLGQFTKNLLFKAKQEGKPSYEVLNDVFAQFRKDGVKVDTSDRTAAKALSILEKEKPGQALPLEQRKIRNEQKPEVAEAHNPLARESNLEERINKIAKPEKTEKASGERLQRDVNEQKAFAEAEYKPLYNRVRERAQGITHNAQPAAQAAVQTLERLQSLQLRPQGYGSTIRDLENFIQDLGYTLERNQDGIVIGAHAPAQAQTSVANLMDLGIRLNDIVNYESLEKSVKDLLKPLIGLVKQETKVGLGQASPIARNLFQKAEDMYASAAQKFNRDSLNKIRSTEAAENIPKLLESPTVLADLKAVLPKGRYNTVERQVLDQLNKTPMAQAEKQFNEAKEYLSPQSRQLGNEIIQQKKFTEFAKEFINENGEINFKAINEALKNPVFIKNLEEIGGREAVTFFRNLEGLTNKLKVNAENTTRIAEHLPKKGTEGQKARGKEILRKSVAKKKPLESFINRIEEKYPLGESTKLALKVIFGIKAPYVAAGGLGLRLLYKLASKPQARKYYMKAVNDSKGNLTGLIDAIESLSNED